MEKITLAQWLELHEERITAIRKENLYRQEQMKSHIAHEKIR